MKVKESKFRFERPILKRFLFNENEDFEKKEELKIEIELEKRIIKNALEINAPSLLVSYIRPLIALVTGNSKYPSWNIPFLCYCNSDFREILEKLS